MGDVIRVLFGENVAKRLYAEACRIDDDPARYNEAYKLYERSMYLHPSADTAINLGAIEHQRGNLEESRAWFDKAVAIDPHHHMAHYNIGVLAYEAECFSEAAAHFRRAIECDSQVPDTWLYLATSFEAIGLRKEAQEAWKFFLTLEPEGTRALVARRRLGGTP